MTVRARATSSAAADALAGGGRCGQRVQARGHRGEGRLHRRVLGLHLLQQPEVDTSRLQEGPDVLVLGLVVVGQLANEVAPRHLDLAGAGGVTVVEVAQGPLGAGDVAANGGMDDLVHAQRLGHAGTLVATAASRRPHLSGRAARVVRLTVRRPRGHNPHRQDESNEGTNDEASRTGRGSRDDGVDGGGRFRRHGIGRALVGSRHVGRRAAGHPGGRAAALPGHRRRLSGAAGRVDRPRRALRGARARARGAASALPAARGLGRPLGRVRPGDRRTRLPGHWSPRRAASDPRRPSTTRSPSPSRPDATPTRRPR